jgi:hypothetical protein
LTNELEVEVSLDFDLAGERAGGGRPRQSAVSVDTDTDGEAGGGPSIVLDRAEWAALVPRLAAKAAFCFPLNPLKALVHDLSTFDEARASAEEAESAYRVLSRRDRVVLNTSKADIQAKIGEVVALGGDGEGVCRVCVPRQTTP